MNIKATISISRCRNGKINLYVEDEASHIQFLELAIDPADFGNVVTGLGHQECDGEVRGLEFVGKRRVSEDRVVEYTGTSMHRADREEWLKQNCQEDGWLLDSYLGSQKSVHWEGGKTFLHYHVMRYEPAEASG